MCQNDHCQIFVSMNILYSSSVHPQQDPWQDTSPSTHIDASRPCHHAATPPSAPAPCLIVLFATRAVIAASNFITSAKDTVLGNPRLDLPFSQHADGHFTADEDTVHVSVNAQPPPNIPEPSTLHVAASSSSSSSVSRATGESSTFAQRKIQKNGRWKHVP